MEPCFLTLIYAVFCPPYGLLKKFKSVNHTLRQAQGKVTKDSLKDHKELNNRQFPLCALRLLCVLCG